MRVWSPSPSHGFPVGASSSFSSPAWPKVALKPASFNRLHTAVKPPSSVVKVLVLTSYRAGGRNCMAYRSTMAVYTLASSLVISDTGASRLLRDDAVVGGDVLLVERLGVEGVVQLPRDAEVPHGLRQHRGGLRVVLLLEVLGIAAVVGDGLVLVAQILRDLLGLRGGEPVPAAHVGQEDRQVVGQGRVLHLLGERGVEPGAGAVQPVLEGVQWFPIEQACFPVQQRLAGLELEGDRLLRVRAAARGGQLVVFAGHMVFDLLVPVDHEAQGGGSARGPR